jgi:hypothetical protein
LTEETSTETACWDSFWPNVTRASIESEAANSASSRASSSLIFAHSASFPGARRGRLFGCAAITRFYAPFLLIAAAAEHRNLQLASLQPHRRDGDVLIVTDALGLDHQRPLRQWRPFLRQEPVAPDGEVDLERVARRKATEGSITLQVA